MEKIYSEKPEIPDSIISNDAEDYKKKFSQKEVNKIIAEQKRKFHKIHEDFLREFEVTKLEELKEKIYKLIDEISLYETREMKKNILVEMGLGEEYIDFIQGEDNETIKKNIVKLTEVLSSNKVVEISINPEKKQIKR